MRPSAKAAAWCLVGLAVGFFVGQRREPTLSPASAPSPPHAGTAEIQTISLPPNGTSLFHQKFGQMTNQSLEGRVAGKHMFRTVMYGDPTGCQQAIAIWDATPADANFGGEYESLRWLCEYSAQTPEMRVQMALRDPDGAVLLRYFDRVGWQSLGQYLGSVYKFESPVKTLARAYA